MSTYDDHVVKLYSKAGDLHAVMLSAQAWQAILTTADPLLQKTFGGKAVEERPEPIQDWNTLLEYWDFAYPPDYKVECAECGATTENWQEDEPRKFRMKAANLSGLVNFQCQQCKARILKRHFKDHVSFECRPHQEA